MNIATAVEIVEAHPDYRLLRRFKPISSYSSTPDELFVWRGLYVDTETTGVDVAKDDILELALLPFTFTRDGIFQVLPGLNYLNDPGRPLDDKIRSITGITNEELKGQSINVDEVDTLVKTVDIVVAHNAGFDRKVVERWMPVFATKPWACSQQDVPWRTEFDAVTERLEALAMMLCGVFYDAHRALADCQIGVHVLATAQDQEGRSAWSRLYENAFKESLRIWAVGSPFSTKDKLSGRGYRWNGGQDGRPKAWHKQISPEQLDEENRWLREECYCVPEVTTTTAIDRYSVRER